MIAGLGRRAAVSGAAAARRRVGGHLAKRENCAAVLRDGLGVRALSVSSSDGPTLQRIDSFVGTGSRSRQKGGPRTAEEAVNNILYNTPADKGLEHRHILSILVDNEPGVLSKVSGMLSARGVNIDSLSVSKTDVKELSRMTIVLVGHDSQIEQAGRQLEDLCDVWAVMDHKKADVLERELAIIKVNCVPPPEGEDEVPLVASRSAVAATPTASYEEMMAAHFHRQAVLETSKMFGATVVDVGTESIIIEIVSWSKRVDGFIRMMQPFGIVEAARSGTIAMNRSAVVGGATEDEGATRTKVDLADLPPS